MLGDPTCAFLSRCVSGMPALVYVPCIYYLEQVDDWDSQSGRIQDSITLSLSPYALS